MTYLKKKQVILALVVVLSVPAPSTANAYGDIFSAMFRMMLVMMNVMSDSMLGNNNSNNDMGWGSGNSLGLGMTTLPMMSGMYGMNPVTGFGGMPGTSPWSGMNSMPMYGASPWSSPFSSGSNPFTNAYPSSASNPYANRGYGGRYSGYPPPQISLLDGRWYGTAGEVLEIRGNRFRLRNVQSGISGAIRLENNIVNLYSPRTGTVTQYTFIRNQSELILQDATGRVLRFRLRPISPATYTF